MFHEPAVVGRVRPTDTPLPRIVALADITRVPAPTLPTVTS